MIRRRGMKPSWIACWVTEKAPEITAWLAMTVAIVARMTSGSRNMSGREEEEGILDDLERGRGIERQDHRALPHIVEHQGGQHEEQPGRRRIGLRPKWPMSA